MASVPRQPRRKRAPERHEVYQYYFLARLNVYYYEYRAASAARGNARLALTTSILGAAQFLTLLNLLYSAIEMPIAARKILTACLSLAVASLAIYQASANLADQHARCALKQGMWIECRRRMSDAWRRLDQGRLTDAEFQDLISFFTDLEKHEVGEMIDLQINALAEVRVWREDGHVPTEELIRKLARKQQRLERELINHESAQARPAAQSA